MAVMLDEQAPARESTQAVVQSRGLKDVWVLMPALNEENALPSVLTALPAVGRVFVIDNGSTDRTAEVARRLGACVVSEPRRGYGSACLRGIAAIQDESRQSGMRPVVVVFLDADFSDSPEILPDLAAPILDNAADLVIGSRMLGQRTPGAMPAHSLWGTRFACWWLRRRLGVPCTDLGPFRSVRWTALQSLGMSDHGFGWTIEMQVKAARAGLRIAEFPAPYRKRIGVSKISGNFWGSLQASCKILWMLARHVVFSKAAAGRPAAPVVDEHALAPDFRAKA